MLHILRLSLAASVSLCAIAQSPLTTTFLNNNGGAVGGAVYFDLTVAVPALVVTGLSLNLTGTGSIEVYTCPATRIGNQSNPAVWSLVSTGTVAGAVAGTPATVNISQFNLSAGTVGMAFKAIGVSHSYTNGIGSNQNYSTTEMSLSAGEAANIAFSGTPFTPRIVNCSISYTVSGSGIFATSTPYGVGCYTSPASFYENFATSASFDLSNSSISMLPTGTGYILLQGISGYVPPSLTATTIALTDDSEGIVTLTSPFPYSTGVASQLYVCSNGFVSVATGNGTGFTPGVSLMLSAPQTGWWAWHDYNPAAVGSGQVKFEQIGGVAYVTWDGVYDFAGTTPLSANTFQMQFDTASGAVHYVFLTMSSAGNSRLVGYSPGGTSIDPGNTDLSVALPAGITRAAVEQSALSIGASGRPILGTSINLVTNNILSGTFLGVTILSFTQINPGIDLAFIGAPNCFQNVGLDISLVFIASGSSFAQPLPIPSSAGYAGINLMAQSAAFSSGANALGVVLSNGLDLRLGNF